MELTRSNFIRLELRAARESKSMTQEDLARLTGLTPSMITLLERGRRLGSVTTWDRLEAILGVDQKILRKVEKERT
jgi:transcriptional regulator with XRE-family HTH domain